MPAKGVFTRTAGELIASLRRHPDDVGATIGDWKADVGAWIRFNPVDGEGVKNDNITRFKYALVESDTMPVPDQDAMYQKLELPIACLVHSGGKSLHAIVRVDAEDYSEYRKRVEYIVEEINVDAAAACFISRGQQATGLGITLGFRPIRDRVAVQVDDRDIVPGVGRKLSRTRHTDIGSSAIYHRGTGAHGHTAHAVVQCQRPAVRQLSVCGYLHTVEASAFGGKIAGIGCCIIYHCTADISIQPFPAVQHFAGSVIQQQKPGGLGGIACRAIIRTHQQIILRHISTGPVIAAYHRMIPGCGFAFSGLGGIFIGNGQADKIGFHHNPAVAHPSSAGNSLTPVDLQR